MDLEEGQAEASGAKRRRDEGRWEIKRRGEEKVGAFRHGGYGIWPLGLPEERAG